MDYHLYPYRSQRMITLGASGMVATSQHLAAQAGLDMLKKGGNAVDAAVATAACLTVLEPCSNGLGGDAFAQVWTGDGLFGLNASGPAPALLDASALRGAGHQAVPMCGFAPQTVPGVVSAWAELSRRFGRLGLMQALRPAIDYAQEGFPVGPTVAGRWKIAAKETYAPCRERPEFAEWYRVFTDGGRAPRAGETWRLPDHAATLTEIARTDGESFYRGAIAAEIDRFMQKAGGYLRSGDLAGYSPEWVAPLRASYRGYDVWELPPNGQGMIALMALNILDGMTVFGPDDPRSWHLAIEAMKLAAVDGYRYIADPRAAALEMTPDALLSARHAARRRALIKDTACLPQPSGPADGGTVYLCAADDEGNMISYIQSNFHGFGSGVVVPGTGIALHNRGSAFSLDAASPNCLAPGKRPFHTIIPGFLSKDGKPVGPFGVMGARMQPQGHLQVLMQMLDWGRNPQAALDAPRWYWTGGRKVLLEQGVPSHIAGALGRMGHEVSCELDCSPFGRGQVILRQENGVLAGGTDPRCDGAAAAW